MNDILNFTEFKETLNEQLLKFNGKTNPTGSVFVIAGGAGSGKSAIVDKMFGFKGKIFNSDRVKEAFGKEENLKFMMTLAKNHPKEFEAAGLKVGEKVDLGDKETVAKLHALTKTLKLDSKEREAFYRANEKSLENIIIDGTFNKMGATIDKIKEAVECGYNPKNIHFVWVLNTLENALDNNNSRTRKIPDELVVSIAKSCAKNVKAAFDHKEFGELVQGDWYVVFNSFNMKTKKAADIRNSAKGRRLIIADYAQIKKHGETPNLNKIEAEILERIKEYTKGEF